MLVKNKTNDNVGAYHYPKDMRMFFMFAFFSQLYPSADSTQQKPPQPSQETHVRRQFVHRNMQAPAEEKPIIEESPYTLYEQAIVPHPIPQDDPLVLVTPSRQMPRSASIPAVHPPIVLPTSTAPQVPPIVINNYTNCSPSVVSSNQNQSEVQANNSMSAQVSANMSAYMEQAQQMINEELPHQMVSLQALLWEYSYRIAGGCVVTAYVTLCYYLYKAMHYLSHRTIWSSWHKELSMEELLAQDITALGKSLIIAIQMRYANPQNPTDFIEPLVAFNIQIQQEIEELRLYWRLYVFCKDWRLIKIVPFAVDQLDALKEHIERATYVQTVFKTWTANYNFVQNVRVQVM